MVNWKIHKALAFIGMALVALIVFGVQGMNLTDKLFNFISFKWVALVAQVYAAWVWYSLVKM